MQRRLEARGLPAPESKFARSFSAGFNRGRRFLFRRGGEVERRYCEGDGRSVGRRDRQVELDVPGAFEASARRRSRRTNGSLHPAAEIVEENGNTEGHQ